VLIGSLLGAALGAYAQGFAPSLNFLILARILSGACGAVGTTANVYVSDVTSESNRGTYLGYLMSSNGLAFAFGPGLGGGLSSFGLNVPIFVDGTLSIVAGILPLVYLPESPGWTHQKGECASSTPDSNKKGLIFFSPSVWLICCVEFFRGFSFSAIFAMYGVFALQVYQLNSLQIGYAVCVGALVLICTNIWVCPRMQHYFDLHGTAISGTILMAIGELVLALAPSLASSLLGMWTVYVGQALAGCMIAAITSMLADDDNRGAIMSIQQTAQAVGRVVGPWSLGYLSDQDPRAPFIAAAFCVMLATACLEVLRQLNKQAYDVHAGYQPDKLSTWEEVVITDEDINDLGTFLCELLTSRNYKWQEPPQREALKKMLQVCFPPLPSSAVAGSDIRDMLTARKGSWEVGGSQRMGQVAFSVGSTDGFVRSPAINNRRKRCSSTA